MGGRRIYLFLVVVLTLVACTLLVVEHAPPAIIRYALVKAGAEVHELHGVSLTLQGAAIDRLRLSMDLPSNTISSTFDKIRLDGGYRRLLQGKPPVIKIAHLNITMQRVVSAAHSVAGTPMLNIPAGSVLIAALNLSLEDQESGLLVRAHTKGDLRIEAGGDGLRISPVALEIEGIPSVLEASLAASGKGHASLNVASIDLGGSPFLATLLERAHLSSLSIESGQASASLSITWSASEALDGLLSVNLSQVAGSMGPAAFEQASLSCAVLPFAGFRSTEPLTLEIGRVMLGAQGRNISVRATTKSENGRLIALDIHKLTGEVFGGRLRLAPALVGLEHTSHALALHLNNINLSEIMKLYPQEKISITGLVNAVLPLNIDTQGVALISGKITSVEPGGVIRAELGDITSASTGPLNIAHRALRNFRYHSLDATVNGAPSGELTIEVHLRGESPDLNTGQPINVNLNIQENVLSLLKSLDVAKQVVEDLERPVRR